MTLLHFATWIVIGLVAGTVAGAAMTATRQGLGRLGNLTVGMVGAVVGGVIVRIAGLLPGLDAIAISLRDLVAAVIGASVLVLSYRISKHFRNRSNRRENSHED